MKLFNVHYFPNITKRNRYMRARFRKATQEEGLKLSDGYMTEERLALTPVLVCPFCMERNPVEFYTKQKEKFLKAQESGNTSEFKRDILNMRRLGESVDEYYNRGLLESEKETSAPHFWQTGDTWFKRDFICMTCGSAYETRPYRKDRYVSLR